MDWTRPTKFLKMCTILFLLRLALGQQREKHHSSVNAQIGLKKKVSLLYNNKMRITKRTKLGGIWEYTWSVLPACIINLTQNQSIITFSRFDCETFVKKNKKTKTILHQNLYAKCNDQLSYMWNYVFVTNEEIIIE